MVDRDEVKNHKLNYLLVLALALLVIFPTIPYLLYRYGVTNPSNVSEHTTFEIKSGNSVSKIARNLEINGLVESSSLFKLYIKLNSLDKKLQAGIYNIPPKTNIAELGKMFQNGYDDKVLTFVEGWRLEEFAQYADEEVDNVTYKEFMFCAKGKEGYLFPDTYIVRNDTTTEELIEVLEKNFHSKTQKLFSEGEGLTEAEVVIFASIVEREMSIEEDRPIVAGILIKRWKEGMGLGADATTQYAIAPRNGSWWPNDLTQADLNFASQYNTRANIGLPPAPISSVGLSAINAVVNSVDSGYYFYLTGNDGKTHFAVTNLDHEYNIEKYLN